MTEESTTNLPLLYFIDDLDYEIGAVSLGIIGAHEVIETHESERKTLCFMILKACENDLHDITKERFQHSSRNNVSEVCYVYLSVTNVRWKVLNHSFQEIKSVAFICLG